MRIETNFLRYWRSLNRRLKLLRKPEASIAMASRAFFIESDPQKATVLF